MLLLSHSIPNFVKVECNLHGWKNISIFSPLGGGGGGGNGGVNFFFSWTDGPRRCLAKN